MNWNIPMEERRLLDGIREGKIRMKNPKTANRGVAKAIRYSQRQLRELRRNESLRVQVNSDWRQHDTNGQY